VSGLVGVWLFRLQKLVYYSRAWHLAWADEQLFPEVIRT
jgi:uncharacterized phage-associated protein